MQRNIKIGFLVPYSSIYPQMIPSLVSGFYSAIPEKYHPMFQVVPEYVGQGGEKQVVNAANKLLNFDQVDILSGLISYLVLPSLIPNIEKRNKLGFFFDMGEYIPYTHHLSDHIFINSFQMWQSEFALGYWAHQQFGEKGTVIMPIYDGGYHLQSAFRQGAVMAGAENLDIQVIKYYPENINALQVASTLENIKKQNPSYIHALFCGTEAEEFFSEYQKAGLSENIPLIASAHMASERVLKEVSNLNLNFYSASMWNYDSIEDVNLLFKRRVSNFAGQKADLFTLLGYEMGLLFEKLIPEFTRKDWIEIKKRLKIENIKGPRGKRSFFLNSEYATPIIDIEKISIGNNKINKICIDQGKAMQYEHETYQNIHKENISGWQNPYLCV